ncbi:MAG: hypothetical protein L0H37_07555, partial [Nitrosospira sp.]|nr:hypothetical protein [Nitrosospira sp.]
EALVGGVGYYAHNVLSAWVTYGFFGFLQFVFLNLLCLFWTIRVAVRRRFKCRPLEVFALIMSSYSVMTMIFSQTVNSPIYAVGWGATVASLLVSKNLDGIGIARAGKKSLYRGGGKSLI